MAFRPKSRRVEDAFELFQLENRGGRASQFSCVELQMMGRPSATTSAMP